MQKLKIGTCGVFPISGVDFPARADLNSLVMAGTMNKKTRPYIYIYIGGWGVSPTGKSVSVSVRFVSCRAGGRGEAA